MLVHNAAIKKLSDADYLIIKKEHKQLEKYLSDLYDACFCSRLASSPDCRTCTQEKQNSCLGRLPSFLFHIIELSGKHFANEEKIMLSRQNVTKDYEYFSFHHQAHVDLMLRLQALSDEYLSTRDESYIGEIYRHLYEKITDMFEEHDHNYDDPFITSTKELVSFS
jgi:hemerythrin